MPRRYPEYTPERIKESKSYQVLLPKFNARRWAFGCSEWQDHGVDYSFEYVQDGFFHGFRLLGQVKGSSHLKFGNADSFSYALPVKTANYAVECSQPFVLFVVDLISATAYYLPLQDYFIANRDKYEKLKVNTSTISVRIAKMVQCTFNNYKESQSYKDAVLSTASALKLSKASVTSYLPYEKGVYFPKEAPVEKISVGAERQRRYRAVRKLRTEPTEKHLWEVVLLYSGVRFKTYSGLPFTYEIRKGRNGQYTKELWIDRRENSKSLAWSSVLLALNNIKEVGAVVDRPKALGDIRGVTYIYGMFYRFGLIDMPDKVNGKMKRAGRQM